jgi:hypothetical protein
MRIAAAVVLLAAGSAVASPIIQTQNFGPTTPNFSQTLTFNQFNGNLADLTGIKVTFNLAATGGSLELDNDGVDPASGNAELGAQAAITSSSVPLINGFFQPIGSGANALSASSISPFAIGGDDGDGANFQPGGSDYFNFGNINATAMAMDTVNPAVWAAYVGAGTFNIDVNALQVFNYGAFGGIAFAGSPVLAQGSVTIEYTFVPAPASAGLLALGGLVAARRRRA